MDYQNLFNRDFFPTPDNVIDIMLQGEDVFNKVCLEPSAGKGNIVNYLNRHGASNVLACEINDTLRRSLIDCDVLCSDFMQLTSEDVVQVDYIIMNPPFLYCENHIKHAFEIAPNGCTIIALMPHSRFSGYSTHWKEFSKMVDLNGTHENIGNVFCEAERTTGVDIELVKLYKSKEGETEFDGYLFDEYETHEFSDGTESGLLPHNKVYELVSRYIDAVKRFDKVMEASKEINDLTGTFSSFRIKFGAKGKDEKGNDLCDIERGRFKKDLQKAAWNEVINLFNLEKFATSTLRNQISKFVETQSSVPFTMGNIYKMVDMIVQTNGQRMTQAIVDAFDTICKFAPENIYGKANNVNEWKTNSGYMVNKKFIVPSIVNLQTFGGNPIVKVHTYGNTFDKISDVMKALCYISGQSMIDIAKEYLHSYYEKTHDWDMRWSDGVDKEYHYTFAQIINNASIDWGTWKEFGWFRVKFFKKGTMHFEFIGDKGDWIWQNLNQTVAKQRGWQVGAQDFTKKRSKKSA